MEQHQLKKWLLVVVIIVASLVAVQQVILKPIIEAVSTQMVGARVTMGGFSLNILTGSIKITDCQIYNEPGFPPRVFFHAPEIFVKTDLLAVMRGKMHFPLVVFRLDKMIIFKNAQGKLNVDELKIVHEKLHDKNKGPAPNFKIDVLKLNIEQVIVEDDSKSPALIEAYDLNLKDKTITNIDSAPKLVGLLMFEVLKPTALQSAGLYAATTLLGVAFLPGLAIGVAIANDAASADFSHSFEQVYQQSLQLVQKLGGRIKRTDHESGLIFAKVYDADVTIEVHKDDWFHAGIIIKARKYLFARPEIAAGILYQLKEELK